MARYVFKQEPSIDITRSEFLDVATNTVVEMLDKAIEDENATVHDLSTAALQYTAFLIALSKKLFPED